MTADFLDNPGAAYEDSEPLVLGRHGKQDPRAPLPRAAGRVVTVTGQIAGDPVRAEIHGPHDVRGDTELVTPAAGLVRGGVQVHYGQPLGGGIASFEDERIAAVTLAAVCDPGSVMFEGLELELPEDGIA